MLSRRVRKVALAAALGLLVGAVGACSDVLSLADLSGDFALTEVDGQSPPRVIGTEEETNNGTTTTRTLTIEEGTVTVATDSSVTLDLTATETVESDGSTDSRTDNDTLTGSVEGGQLSFDSGSIQLVTYTFVVTGGSLDDTAATLSLSRTDTPFDVSVSLRFER